MKMIHRCLAWWLRRSTATVKESRFPFLTVILVDVMKLRAQVWERSGGYCERCQIPLHPEQWALHHRKLRSQGGKDELPNLIALHHHCHNLGTDSVHLNPKEATRRGLIVSSWDDPSNITVEFDDGTLVYLTDDGRYKETAWPANQQSSSPTGD